MNTKQNERISQVSSDTLVIGVDIGEEKHYARAFDYRGLEFSRRALSFSNSAAGFNIFYKWLEEIKERTRMKKVIIGCEPTGHYWFTFQKFLHDHKLKLVVVNPYSVNRSKELDDNSPEKDDIKDPKTIAGLVREGRYSTAYIPEGNYAEIREAQVCRDQIMKQHVRLSNQIQAWLQQYFPEYLEVYNKFDAESGFLVLEKVPLPADIIKLGAEGIKQIWKDAKLRGRLGISRAQTLIEAAQESVGLQGGEAARFRIRVLISDYRRKQEQLERVDEILQKKVMLVPNVEKLLAIKGVGFSSVAGFIAEVGDIGRFTDPKQIQKLAGLEITKLSSGKRKGKPGISKRGRRRLRRVMYEAARALMIWDPAFGDLFLYYRNRMCHPLGSMQAKIAVECKAIRVFYAILKHGCDYDPKKLQKDIIRPATA